MGIFLLKTVNWLVVLEKENRIITTKEKERKKDCLVLLVFLFSFEKKK